MQNPYYSNPTGTVDVEEFLVDNLFNFLILMLISQLLAGIIIDKFGDLRDE